MVLSALFSELPAMTRIAGYFSCLLCSFLICFSQFSFPSLSICWTILEHAQACLFFINFCIIYKSK